MKVVDKECKMCGEILNNVFPNTKFCDNCRRLQHNKHNAIYYRKPSKYYRGFKNLNGQRVCVVCETVCGGKECITCFLKKGSGLAKSLPKIRKRHKEKEEYEKKYGKKLTKKEMRYEKQKNSYYEHIRNWAGTTNQWVH